jgi:hypothetical protein
MQSLSKRFKNRKQEIIKYVNGYGIFHAMEEFGVNDYIAMKRFLNLPETPQRKREHKQSGYIVTYMPEHPRANKNGYVKRARLILERKLGRPLLPNMLIHHKNGIRDDDRPANLEELTDSEHQIAHFNLKRQSPLFRM